jgi:hypothetical protein
MFTECSLNVHLCVSDNSDLGVGEDGSVDIEAGVDVAAVSKR